MAVLSHGKHQKACCSAKDSPLISIKVDKLTLLGQANLYSDSLSRKHQLEEDLLQLGQLHDALVELLIWIAGNMTRLAGQVQGCSLIMWRNTGLELGEGVCCNL